MRAEWCVNVNVDEPYLQDGGRGGRASGRQRLSRTQNDDSSGSDSGPGGGCVLSDLSARSFRMSERLSRGLD